MLLLTPKNIVEQRSQYRKQYYRDNPEDFLLGVLVALDNVYDDDHVNYEDEE